MKFRALIMLLFFLFAILAFSQTKKINLEQSSIKWVGKKIVSSHNGNLKFKSGFLFFKKKKLIGGMFVVDMNTINTLDLNGEKKIKLDEHLKDSDFFNVSKFPTASLVFNKIKSLKKGNYQITSDLTIKGIKKSDITFVLSTYKKSANASFEIDRTVYGIKYGSGSFFDNLGDKMIDDHVNVKVSLIY